MTKCIQRNVETLRRASRERILSRAYLANTSRATTLNRKCNGFHFSKCSSQCCGVIFVLNNSKVVMIKMSFTLISWLLIVLTITSSPVYTLLIRRSGDKRYSAACMQAKQGSCVSRPRESLLSSQLVFDLARDDTFCHVQGEARNVEIASASSEWWESIFEGPQ